MRRIACLTSLVCLTLATPGIAQTGTLDQVSPASNASFSVSLSYLIWQQQVRAGKAGQLEGFELTLTGSVGAQVDVRLRVGDGWNTNAIVWSTTYAKVTSNEETPFFDVTSAGVQLAVGDTFVIETQGNDTGTGLRGNYLDPADGPPFYPEELYEDGPGCFANCGWRHGFRSWILEGPGPGYCVSAPNSTGSAALISFTGTTSIAASDLELVAQPVPDQPGIFFYGPDQVQMPFGDGFRCVGGPSGRLPVQNASGNVLTQALDYSQPPNSFTVITAGSTWNFQAWFRDPAAMGAGFNLTNGLSLSFLP